MDAAKVDREITQKIEKVTGNPKIMRSREMQRHADNLIKQRQEFRKNHGLDKKN